VTVGVVRSLGGSVVADAMPGRCDQRLVRRATAAGSRYVVLAVANGAEHDSKAALPDGMGKLMDVVLYTSLHRCT
jgi:hypothetical protein